MVVTSLQLVVGIRTPLFSTAGSFSTLSIAYSCRGMESVRVRKAWEQEGQPGTQQAGRPQKMARERGGKRERERTGNLSDAKISRIVDSVSSRDR